LRDRSPNWDFPGLYLGEANDFADIVNFWNLRAASVDVFFFDPTHEARLGEMARAYLKLLKERPRKDGIRGRSQHLVEGRQERGFGALSG
jgi:hypothetical protein